ncbi:MAG: energy-coupling factor transporter transmembrane component T [Candidatus Neomarinimicrobiota bacterium]|nr:energy-coupling factor transporter transmembrane component T [Candidatus Neomarinimicrobiota bacterium]
MFTHPIVNLYFFLALSLSLMLASSFLQLMNYGIVILIIALKNTKLIPIVVRKYLPTLFFFPIMLFIYILFSYILTDSTIYQTISEAFNAFIKFSFMIISMNFYLELSSAENLIKSLRSFWARLNIQWKWVDNFFLFLALALRFYPTFQSQWQHQRNSQKVLGIKFNDSYYGRLIEISKELPSILVYQLDRSEDISLAMKLRGYGSYFPRKIVDPIYFNITNFLQFFLVTIFFIQLFRFVAI